MTTSSAVREITASQASALAGITYRQLDYWARRGWVRPSLDVGLGRAGRRLYGPADVIRLSALGHFGASSLDVGRLGPELAQLELPLDTDFLLIAEAGGAIAVVAGDELREVVSAAGARVVFDPRPLRERLGLVPHRAPVVSARSREVRSA